MTTQEQKQFKISIFSSAFKFLLKPLISTVKKEFKEHALEWLIEIVKDAFEKTDDVSVADIICPPGYSPDGKGGCVKDPLN